MFVIPALWRLRLEDEEAEASLGVIAKHYFKTKQKQNTPQGACFGW
jgi:hypothetical protein